MYVVWIFVVMLFGLVACGDDDAVFSPETQAYILANKTFMWEKKAQTDAQGDLLYTQVIVDKDTALYRILKKENDYVSKPDLNSTVYFKEMKGELIDGSVFMKPTDVSFAPAELIPGFKYALLEMSPDETIELLIPAPLGYGYVSNGGIPAGSTLIFTFTIDKIM